jgi:YD repeat-containing protein
MQVRLSCASLLILIASITAAQQSSHSDPSIVDREKAGLRGSVKTVIDEQTMSLPNGDEVFTTITKYTSEGRILEERTKSSDGSERVTSYTYQPDGRLLKTVTGNEGSADKSETTYSYDEAGRLVVVKYGDTIQTRYQYDDAGRKSSIENYDSKPLPLNTAYAAHWEGTDLGFAPSPGGKVTTAYNEQGVATEAKFYDAENNLVGHIVRKFDPDGRISSEEQIADAPQVNLLPEEMRSNLNPEQMKSVGAFFAGAQHRIISYSYDAQGHVTERHAHGLILGDQVTITTYNDHGDKASERVTTAMASDTGPWNLTEAGAFIPTGKPNPPLPKFASETQYTYQYDQYGNWTEQTTADRSQPDEALRPGTTIRRKLTYY